MDTAKKTNQQVKDTHTYILEYTGDKTKIQDEPQKQRKKGMKMEDEEQRWRAADFDKDARRNGIPW